MAIDKSKWDLGIKVSQKMIDAIKKQGMTAALKNVKTSSDAEYVEGVRRLYTPERVAAIRPNWRVSTEDKANYKGSYQTGAQTPPATPPNSGLSGTVAAALKTPKPGPAPYVDPNAVKRRSQIMASSSVGRGGIGGLAHPTKKSVTPPITPAQQKVISAAKRRLQLGASGAVGRGGLGNISGALKKK